MRRNTAMTARNSYDRVAKVAVRVALLFTTATRKNPVIPKASRLLVAEVAVLQTSQPNFEDVCRKYM